MNNTITVSKALAKDLLLLTKGKNFYASKRRELAETLERLLDVKPTVDDLKVFVLTFGKYKGKTHDYVYRLDPTYLTWAYGKGLTPMSKYVSLSAEAKEEEDYDSMAEGLGHEDWGDRQ